MVKILSVFVAFLENMNFTRNSVNFKIWPKWQNKLHLSIFVKMKQRIVAKTAWWFPHLKDFPNKNNAIKAKCKTSWGHPSQKPYNYHLDLLQVQRNSSFFVALQTVQKTTKFKYRAKLEFAWSPSKVKSWAKPLSIYPLFWSSPIFTYWQYNLSVTVANYLVKGDEVNGDALSNAIVDFLNIYVIVLLQ